jgi:hypothetical protein
MDHTGHQQQRSVRQACRATAALPRSRSEKTSVAHNLSVATRKANASLKELGLIRNSQSTCVGWIKNKAVSSPSCPAARFSSVQLPMPTARSVQNERTCQIALSIV